VSDKKAEQISKKKNKTGKKQIKKIKSIWSTTIGNNRERETKEQ
jgi:hypothetical protein